MKEGGNGMGYAYYRNESIIRSKTKEFFGVGTVVTAPTYLVLVVDFMLIGWIFGADAVAAAGLCDTFVDVAEFPGFVISAGGPVAAGILLGKRQFRQADGVFTLSFLLTLIGSLLCWCSLPFCGLIGKTLSNNGAIAGDVASYTFLIMAASPFVGIDLVFSSFAILDNHSKLAMGSVILSNVVNIVLDVILMKYLNMGVAGAAAASLLGSVVGILVGLPYMFTSFIAGITGVGVFYLFQPGTEGSFVSMITKQETVGTTISFIDTVIKIFPSNIVGAFYDNDVLQILIMGLFMGVVVNLIGEKGKILQDFFEAMNELFLKMVMLLAKLIPLITFCSVMILILTTGTDALLSLLALIGTLLVGLAVLIITYAIMILLIAKVSPFPFLKRYVPTALNVFSLSSSSASMPLNMDFCKKIGISQRVYSFTIPFGATINMDGVMVVFMTGVLFMAKTFGVTIDSSHIIILVVSGLLLSMATPGVPGAALVACTVLLNQMGVPMDCLPLVMIYLTITDMVCKVSNTTGDVAASVIVASTEKILDKDKYYQQD